MIDIGNEVFTGCTDVEIVCTEGSFAASYMAQHLAEVGKVTVAKVSLRDSIIAMDTGRVEQGTNYEVTYTLGGVEYRATINSVVGITALSRGSGAARVDLLDELRTAGADYVVRILSLNDDSFVTRLSFASQDPRFVGRDVEETYTISVMNDGTVARCMSEISVLSEKTDSFLIGSSAADYGEDGTVQSRTNLLKRDVKVAGERGPTQSMTTSIALYDDDGEATTVSKYITAINPLDSSAMTYQREHHKTELSVPGSDEALTVIDGGQRTSSYENVDSFEEVMTTPPTSTKTASVSSSLESYENQLTPMRVEYATDYTFAADSAVYTGWDWAWLYLIGDSSASDTLMSYTVTQYTCEGGVWESSKVQITGLNADTVADTVTYKNAAGTPSLDQLVGARVEATNSVLNEDGTPASTETFGGVVETTGEGAAADCFITVSDVSDPGASITIHKDGAVESTGEPREDLGDDILAAETLIDPYSTAPAGSTDSQADAKNIAVTSVEAIQSESEFNAGVSSVENATAVEAALTNN